MNDRPDAATAALLLTSRLLESDAKPLTARELWSLAASGVDLAELLRELPTDLPPTVDRDRLARRLTLGQALGFALDDLDHVGIRTLTAFDSAFPSRLRERLGSACPVVLYVAGDPVLLTHPCVGIVGSRDISEAGLAHTEDVARAAIASGHGVISGCARGVDRAAMNAALQAEGPVVGFPADRMDRALREAETRAGILAGRVLLATPFRPDAGFSVGNAMGRNKLIYATAAMTIAMACSDGSGGTWAGATEALRKNYGRVAVWTGPDAPASNAALADAGAHPISSSDALATALATSPEPDLTQPEQLGLAV